jgi:hypothetical protein
MQDANKANPAAKETGERNPATERRPAAERRPTRNRCLAPAFFSDWDMLNTQFSTHLERL